MFYTPQQLFVKKLFFLMQHIWPMLFNYLRLISGLKLTPRVLPISTTLRFKNTSQFTYSDSKSPKNRIPDQPPSLKHFTEEWNDDIKWTDDDTEWTSDAADESGALLPDFPNELKVPTAKISSTKAPKAKETKQFSISIERVPDQPSSLKQLYEEWEDDDDIKWTDEDIGLADDTTDETDSLLPEFPTEASTSPDEPTPKEDPKNCVSEQPPSLKHLSEEWNDDDNIGWSNEAADNTDALLPEFPTEISASTDKPILKKTPKPTRIKHDWTSKELKRLLEAVKQSQDNAGSIDWTKVAKCFPQHTLQSCISVYTKTTGTDDRAQRLAQCKQKMSSEDEQKLVEIIRQRGECDWDGVSMDLMESTGIAKGSVYLKTLWARRLCPKAQTAPQWTRDKTEQLKRVLKMHGNEPVFLTYRFFPQYTPIMISIMIRRLGTDMEALDPRESSIPKVKIQRRKPLHL